jgi:corrinoid protein of di/trimethylamine methyltransferase
MNTWKTNLEETKQRYIDWWNHRGVIINMWEHFQEGVTPHADVPAPKPYKDLNQRWFDPEWRAQYLDWYVAHSSLKADMLPVANTQLGPGSLAAILGGVLEGGEDTIWIHPDPDFSDDIVFNPQHPNWLLHKELLRACKRRAQGHYYVGMPDLMEGLDVLAALKGTDRVLMDTVMQPEVVERQMQQINDIYFRVFDELYDIIREGDEMAFCYFSSWAPGKMTKLQSDISTMISEDDYRRFVQPFIREQCQRIPFTLYHLDGVGAMHHLPALLEIEELNAIQWTPGVGQPQGGNPKWYDLYRRILDAGKSVMCCWVTLPELRPLLDAIGTEGVHIEMDFHNEEEVDEALHIVKSLTSNPSPKERGTYSSVSEHYTDEEAEQEVDEIISKIEIQKKSANNTICSPLLTRGVGGEALLLLDGAMGTMIQQYHLREEDYRGCRFANHPVDLKGCNDILSLTAPFIVRDIHRKYLAAGADIIETNTFNAQRISMADYGLALQCRDINLAAARLARECADEFSSSDKPRFVAGSIGPTSKTISIDDEDVMEGAHDVSAALSGAADPTPCSGGVPEGRNLLREAYEEQIQALADGGVDFLLIETIFDVENARIAIDAARKVAPHLPVMLSFSVATPEGHNMLGQNILEFLRGLSEPLQRKGVATSKTTPLEGLGRAFFSIGINCITDVAAMTPLVKELARFGTRVSLYPNAGQPDAQGRYLKTPESLLADVWPLLEGHHLNIIGGCCGTTDAHIRLMAKAIEPVPGIRLSGAVPCLGDDSCRAAAPLPCRGGVPEGRGGVSNSSHILTPPPTPPLQGRGAAAHSLQGRGAAAHSLQGRGVAAHSLQGMGAAAHSLQGRGAAAHSLSLKEAIIAGKSDDAVEATKVALAAGAAPQALINDEMIRAMSEVGQRFQDGKAFVPQLLMAGRAMKAALAELKPLMTGEASTAVGKVVIGTVKGDLHDIGKNLVASMLEGCGFEVINIGIDVSADRFIEEVKKHQPDILCMSALLTTTMGYMREVIEALEKAGIRQQVKVMVGGAPVTQGFADEIGADGYSDNANTAVTVAKQLISWS